MLVFRWASPTASSLFREYPVQHLPPVAHADRRSMVSAFKTTKLHRITRRFLAYIPIESFLLVDCENRIATTMSKKNRHTLLECR